MPNGSIMEAVISQSAIDAYLLSLPSEDERTEFSARIRSLQEITSDADNLSDFLAEFSQGVAELYAATSVAIWFQAPSRKTVERKVDVGWKNLRLDAPTEQAHKKLIELAIQSKEPFAAQPFSAPLLKSTDKANTSNPTDSYLLFTPVAFEQQEVAVLEIALGPKPLRQPHQELLEAYLEWLGWLRELARQGMQRCFAQTDEPLVAALGTLQQATLDVEAIQAQIRDHIQTAVQSFAGQNFGSLAANQLVAKQVHALLDGKGLRVRCPECGTPAILRCQNAGNSKTGAFMYDHYLESGRTFHGGQTTFPKIEVVPKPPRRNSK